MSGNGLGRICRDGELIIRQGETGECMYVVLDGQVEVFVEEADHEVRLAVKGKGEFIGEMAVFEREVRSANVRAMGQVRVLTVDRKTLLRRIQEDPSLALSMMEVLSQRLRQTSQELVKFKEEKEVTAPSA